MKQLGFIGSTQKNEKRNFLNNLMDFQFRVKEQNVNDPKTSNIE